MLQQGVFHLPDPWYGQNYIEVVTNGFFGYFIRSVWVVALSLVLMLIIAAFASYPLARMSFRMNALIFAGIVAMMSVPMHVTLIPIFKMTTDIGLYNTDWALIGPYVTFALPMSVFILTAFMKTIPHEIEESAEIDGCNRYQNFFVMILPLSKSGLATLSIYNGVSMWNEFAFANTLLQSPEVKTLPLALGQFKGEHSLDIPMILAVLTLSVLPMIILFIIFQDKLIKGMMAGAVKG
jgi:raffinose/stachyose/melibiose transport system permease protein